MRLIQAIQEQIGLDRQNTGLEGEKHEIQVDLFSVLQIQEFTECPEISVDFWSKWFWTDFSFYYKGILIGEIACTLMDSHNMIISISSINMLNRDYRRQFAYYEFKKPAYLKAKQELLGDNADLLLNIRGIGTYMLYFVLKYFKEHGKEKLIILDVGPDDKIFFERVLAKLVQNGFIKGYSIQNQEGYVKGRTDVEGYIIDL